jgi:hypothetical protein
MPVQFQSYDVAWQYDMLYANFKCKILYLSFYRKHKNCYFHRRQCLIYILKTYFAKITFNIDERFTAHQVNFYLCSDVGVFLL